MILTDCTHCVGMYPATPYQYHVTLPLLDRRGTKHSLLMFLSTHTGAIKVQCQTLVPRRRASQVVDASRLPSPLFAIVMSSQLLVRNNHAQNLFPVSDLEILRSFSRETS
jgi:hypothetical protein